MQTQPLRVGAGRAEIELPPGFFPTEDFRGIHDPLHARVLLIESGNKLAFVSLELTSLTDTVVRDLQQLVSQAADMPPENALICVTHTLSAPHFLPEHQVPGARQKNAQLLQALRTAVERATAQAVATRQDARFGCAVGVCDVNVNRDIATPEGWWLGFNETGVSDKTVPVYRFETLDGAPIALLFCCNVQPAVMDGSVTTTGGRLVTADMAGAACRFLERACGETVTALFCLGAAADQAPALKARHQYVASDGHIQVDDIHEQGHIIAAMLGKRLVIAVLDVAQKIACQPSIHPLSVETHLLTFPGQQIAPDMRAIRPTRQYTFAAADAREEPVQIVRLGECVLIGVRPELTCQTAGCLKEQSPFASTTLVTMVNGGAKYMADASAYDRITYTAMNSFFARGSAELLCEKVVELLRSDKFRSGII